jgi:hypothetical protein
MIKVARGSVLLTLIFAMSIVVAAGQAQPGAVVPILPLDKINSQAELEQTTRALDAELFDAYNKCRSAKVWVVD